MTRSSRTTSIPAPSSPRRSSATRPSSASTTSWPRLPSRRASVWRLSRLSSTTRIRPGGDRRGRRGPRGLPTASLMRPAPRRAPSPSAATTRSSSARAAAASAPAPSRSPLPRALLERPGDLREPVRADRRGVALERVGGDERAGRRRRPRRAASIAARNPGASARNVSTSSSTNAGSSPTASSSSARTAASSVSATGRPGRARRRGRDRRRRQRARQHLRPDRLRDVVVHARRRGTSRGPPPSRWPSSRRSTATGPAQRLAGPPGRLEAVHLRHLDVHQHEVVRRRARGRRAPPGRCSATSAV